MDLGTHSKSDLRAIARWKSPRIIRHIERNSPSLIKSISTKAFRTKSERAKLPLLMELKGVSVPMASAILMFRNPKRYPVIDIRAWQVLHQMNAVSKNAGGNRFQLQSLVSVPKDSAPSCIETRRRGARHRSNSISRACRVSNWAPISEKRLASSL